MDLQSEAMKLTEEVTKYLQSAPIDVSTLYYADELYTLCYNEVFDRFIEAQEALENDIKENT